MGHGCAECGKQRPRGQLVCGTTRNCLCKNTELVRARLIWAASICLNNHVVLLLTRLEVPELHILARHDIKHARAELLLAIISRLSKSIQLI